MNKAEYWILRRAVKHYECLRDVAYECGLNQAEVAGAANRLFHNGDIKARVATHDEDFEETPNAYLTMSEIQACLDGKLRAYYALTPQGGNRWEAVAHADWNRYFEWSSEKYNVESELFDCELTGSNQQLIEELLSIDCYLPSHSIHIPETEIWDVLEPWQPTYWKTLPRAYRVRYQARNRVPHICGDTPLDLFEAYKQAEKRYSEIRQWYTDPKFEQEPSRFTDYTATNYYVADRETASERAKYFILSYAVMRDSDFGDFGGVALDCNLSHAETLTAVHSLFQNGDILAQVYRGGTKVSDAVMTEAEIGANLDGKLQAYYYLTPQGGTRWEAMAHPNWNQYYKYICKDYRPDEIPEYEIEIASFSRQLIEKLLSVSSYVLSEVPIPGTEIWDRIEPWQATYWKTLPKAYRVRYQARQNNFIDVNTSPEWDAAMSQAYEWFSEIQQWYTEPKFE